MSSIRPVTNKSHDLGTSSYKWGSAHLGTVNAETGSISGNFTVSGDLTVSTVNGTSFNFSDPISANDILTKIKTVDGSGSGLDADLLDNISSAGFVQIAGSQTITGDKTFSGAIALGASGSATTPSANDNSTKVATTAYVDGAVGSLTTGVSAVNTKTGSVTLYTDDITEDGSPTNLWFTDTRARTAAVVNTTSGSETNQAPSVSSIKSYVDAKFENAVQGIDYHTACKTASSANVNLASPGAAINGYTFTTTGERVLLKDQTDQKENGIYDWNGAAVALTRSADSDDNPDGEVTGGMFTFIEAGNLAGTSWILITPAGGVSIGTDNLVFAQFNAGSAYVGAEGISISGLDISLNLNELTTITSLASGDKISLTDVSDSNANKNITVSNLGSYLAGSGLTSTNGILTPDNTVVATLSGTQTFTGDKTFSGAVVLGSSATASTQTANNNSTAVATTAYVDAAVSNVTGSGGVTLTSDNQSGLYISGSTIKVSNVNISGEYTTNAGTNKFLMFPTGASELPLRYTTQTNLASNLISGSSGLSSTSGVISLDTSVVATLSGTQTFTGAKTLNGAVTFGSTVSLGGSATATTPSANDNSTKVATTAYVDTGLLTHHVDVQTVSTTSSIAITNLHTYLRCTNVDSSSITITLPNGSSYVGHMVYVKVINSATVNIAAPTAQIYVDSATAVSSFAADVTGLAYTLIGHSGGWDVV
jgi:hypothetical protein